MVSEENYLVKDFSGKILVMWSVKVSLQDFSDKWIEKLGIGYSIIFLSSATFSQE